MCKNTKGTLGPGSYPLDPNGFWERITGTMPTTPDDGDAVWVRREGDGYLSFGGTGPIMFWTTTGSPIDVRVYVDYNTHTYFLHDPTNGDVDSGVSSVLNQWDHVALDVDGGSTTTTLRLVINGTVVLTQTMNFVWGTLFGFFLACDSNGFSPHKFDGSIVAPIVKQRAEGSGAAAFWTTQLTTQFDPVSTTGLYSYVRMANGGSATADTSGNGFDYTTNGTEQDGSLPEPTFAAGGPVWFEDVFQPRRPLQPRRPPELWTFGAVSAPPAPLALPTEQPPRPRIVRARMPTWGDAPIGGVASLRSWLTDVVPPIAHARAPRTETAAPFTTSTAPTVATTIGDDPAPPDRPRPPPRAAEPPWFQVPLQPIAPLPWESSSIAPPAARRVTRAIESLIPGPTAVGAIPDPAPPPPPRPPRSLPIVDSWFGAVVQALGALPWASDLPRRPYAPRLLAGAVGDIMTPSSAPPPPPQTLIGELLLRTRQLWGRILPGDAPPAAFTPLRPSFVDAADPARAPRPAPRVFVAAETIGPAAAAPPPPGALDDQPARAPRPIPRAPVPGETIGAATAVSTPPSALNDQAPIARPRRPPPLQDGSIGAPPPLPLADPGPIAPPPAAARRPGPREELPLGAPLRTFVEDWLPPRPRPPRAAAADAISLRSTVVALIDEFIPRARQPKPRPTDPSAFDQIPPPPITGMGWIDTNPWKPPHPPRGRFMDALTSWFLQIAKTARLPRVALGSGASRTGGAGGPTRSDGSGGPTGSGGSSGRTS